MGALIAVVGNTGVGKTTLVRALAAAGGFEAGLEQHPERPFQSLFKTDRRYALANQIDYLLLRAEQERGLRTGTRTGLQDGGLEMDFYVFTRLFNQKGFLTQPEFDLCARLHTQIRSAQPEPELFIRLKAPLEVVTRRFARRGRPLEIAERADLSNIEALLDDWLDPLGASRRIDLDCSTDDPSAENLVPTALDLIARNLTVHP